MMEFFKKLCLKILYPPRWLAFIIVPVSFGLLIYSSLALGSENFLSYISYFLSAYSLTVICVSMPKIINFFKRLKKENKYISLYFSDEKIRLKASLVTSLVLNFAFAIFQLWLGIWHGSAWYYTMAAYYALLCLMRAYLLRDMFCESRDIRSEYKKYILSGALLTLMNIVLGGMVLFITRFGRGAEHHYITTIALAAFTFTNITMAIIAVVRYKKYNSPLYSAVKAVSLASAAVSMLTLETAMLNAFGEADGEEFRRIITAVTGGAVCVFVLAIGIVMILRGRAALRSLGSEENAEHANCDE